MPDAKALMMQWQYKVLIAQLDHVFLHASDDSCPCNQFDMGEYCLAKHLLDIWTLASETASMYDLQRDLFNRLSSEADEHHEKAKKIYCKGGAWPDLAEWAREWRKTIEPFYYSCTNADKAKMREIIPAPIDQANMSESKSEIQVRGKCTDKTCEFKVKGVDTEAGAASSIKQLSDVISNVEKRMKDKAKEPATNKTYAIGSTNLTRYNFEYQIADAEDLIVSHDPFTFAVNSQYPQELQPRLRDRAATQLQIERIAADIQPEALLSEFHAVDRGAPIIGKDRVVESGNGRVMSLRRAQKDFPASFDKYVEELKKVAPLYALSPINIGKMKVPVLVRLRLTDVADRKAFAEETNASTTIESSSVEKARTDAKKITPAMLSNLLVLEGESIEDAVRALRNKNFVTVFMQKLPDNEQAKLVDSKGTLNQDGIRRIVMALFVSAFPGDTGLQLAQAFYESTDISVKNVFNGIAGSLGLLAKLESLSKNKNYTIGDDLAHAVQVFSAIKKTPGLTVSKYIDQMQIFERQLTPFQENILKALDEHSRSGKRIAGILSGYAQRVIDMPPPEQSSMMGDLPAPTKEQLFENAVKGLLALAVVAEMYESGTLEIIPHEIGIPHIIELLDHCNLSENEIGIALSWRPLRNFVATAIGMKKKVRLCSIGMVYGLYQLEVLGLYNDEMQKLSYLAKKMNTTNRIYTPNNELIYEVVLPQSKEELEWSPQEINKDRPFSEKTEQATLFESDIHELKTAIEQAEEIIL